MNNVYLPLERGTYSSLALPDADVFREVVAVHERDLRQEVLDLCIVPTSSRETPVGEQRRHLLGKHTRPPTVSWG